MTDTANVSVRDNPEAGQFEVWVGDERAAVTRYQARGGDTYGFTHTQVEPQFEHRGLVSRLIGEALAAARERGWSVLPECPYVRKYVQEHEELVDLVPEYAQRRFGLT